MHCQFNNRVSLARTVSSLKKTRILSRTDDERKLKRVEEASPHSAGKWSFICII